MNKRISRRNGLILVMIIALLLGGMVVGCGKKEAAPVVKNEDQVKEEKMIPVKVEVAQLGDLRNYITLTGEVEPIRVTQVTPQLQAEVKKIDVEVGEVVKEGDLLFKLDDETVKIQLEQAQAAYQAARANLEKILAGTREEQLAQLKAQLEQVKASYDQSQKSYERQKRLYEKEIISQQQFEASKSQYIAAKSGYQAAQENLRMAKNGATKEEIKALEAQVAQAKSNVKAAKVRLKRATVTAPISGIISNVNAEVGEMVGMSPIISIVNIDQVKIMTYISEDNVNKVETGQKVEVSFNSLNRDFIGKVKSISPVADLHKKNFPVEILVNNDNNLIKAGMYAKVKFTIDSSLGQIVIPQEAVLNNDDGQYLYIVQSGKAVCRDITTGLSTGDKVVIRNGLNKGDSVIITGQEEIKEGSKVKVVNRGGN